VIKEVIKEVPVETVVTKIEYISDNTQINELLLKIQQLESRPPEIIEIIKEVLMDKIVIQEKIVEVDKSNDKSKLLEVTLQNLRKELSLKNETIKDLENKNKQLESVNIDRGAVYMKGSNITQNM
jgi:hypothetical protein